MSLCPDCGKSEMGTAGCPSCGVNLPGGTTAASPPMPIIPPPIPQHYIRVPSACCQNCKFLIDTQCTKWPGVIYPSNSSKSLFWVCDDFEVKGFLTN